MIIKIIMIITIPIALIIIVIPNLNKSVRKALQKASKDYKK